MPRKKCKRNVECTPDNHFYKPMGIPKCDLEIVNLNIDELEAIRLADLGGLYQEAAAEKMHVSRQTFGRIVSEAHKKIADAIVNGKGIQIENIENQPIIF